MAVAKDGFLSRFVAGGRSRQEVAAVARDGPVEDNEENRRLSWQRMSLLVLYFGPSGNTCYSMWHMDRWHDISVTCSDHGRVIMQSCVDACIM